MLANYTLKGLFRDEIRRKAAFFLAKTCTKLIYSYEQSADYADQLRTIFLRLPLLVSTVRAKTIFAAGPAGRSAAEPLEFLDSEEDVQILSPFLQKWMKYNCQISSMRT